MHVNYNYCIVRAGNVGLATAYALVNKNPSARIVIIEKESAPGVHQTGHNSGVIHAGIYYTPGSFKALLCREGYDKWAVNLRDSLDFASYSGFWKLVYKYRAHALHEL